MFKSIFKRLLMTYLMITILVVASLSFMISYIYKNAIFDEKRNSLESVSQKVGGLTQDFLNKEMTEGELKAAIDAMAFSTDAIIYVLNIDPQKFQGQQTLALNGLQDAFVLEDIKSVLNGQTVFRNKQYSKDFGTYVLFVGSPLIVNDAIQGAILLLCPINNINSMVGRMTMIIWAVALAVILLSIPFIYLNSRRISNPIRKMEAAARKIAAGERSAYSIIPAEDEIGKLSRSFDDMKNQLEKTEKIRRELIANVSHELRTPLTSINGFVQGMLDGVVRPEDQREYLIIIQQETLRLIDLTSELLNLAKIQTGNINVQTEAIYLEGLVESIKAELGLLAEQKNIMMNQQINSNIVVVADLSLLKQVLINIISNAIKYTPNGGHVLIEAETRNGEVQIKVIDDGIGISAEDLPFIFEKFYRSDKVRNPADRSTGLGLSIAKDLILLNGGAIRAESLEGQGTMIIFTLPSAV